MSNEERNLTKIPHSGEPVVQEFTKPLDQAVAEGLVKTPETSADIPQTSEKKKGKKGLIGAGVGLAGLALGGSLFLGLGNNANGGEQAPEPNQPVPTDVAEPGPSEPEAPVDPEVPSAETIEPVTFTPELSGDQIANQLVETTMSEWLNAGADVSLYNRVIEENLAWEDLIQSVAAENASAYAVALFGEDWQSNESVSAFVSQMQAANAGVLARYAETKFQITSGGAETIGFETNLEVSQVVTDALEGDVRSLMIQYTHTDNRVESGATNLPASYPTGIVEITFNTAASSMTIGTIKNYEDAR